LAVTPGFIDLHTHSDQVPFSNHVLESKVAQGVTMELVGNCGSSILPALPERWEDMVEYVRQKKGVLKEPIASVADYAKRAEEKKNMSINYGVLVGHSALRISVMGFVNRDPDAEEMEQLKALLDRELSRGAYGMSLGLIYPPSAFSAKAELVELAKVIAKHDGILSIHMRNEGPRIFEAVDEVISIAEESGVHVQISHQTIFSCLTFLSITWREASSS
jgi:N-acyl-D-amino-acid deacylase